MHVYYFFKDNSAWLQLSLFLPERSTPAITPRGIYKYGGCRFTYSSTSIKASGRKTDKLTRTSNLVTTTISFMRVYMKADILWLS